MAELMTKLLKMTVTLQTVGIAMINLEDIAKYLGVNKDTLRNWIKKKTIPPTKLDGN
jgi:hypothetical protein